MLVLSRKKNESIIINDNITIVVVEIRGDKVRLGIEAPKEVPVHRREVYEAIKRGEEQKKKEDEKEMGNPLSPIRIKLAAQEMRELSEADEQKKKEDETP